MLVVSVWDDFFRVSVSDGLSTLVVVRRFDRSIEWDVLFRQRIAVVGVRVSCYALHRIKFAEKTDWLTRTGKHFAFEGRLYLAGH